MRFLTQIITGVQRFAFEITKELDRILDAHHKIELIGLLPKKDIKKQYLSHSYKNIKLIQCGKLSGHLWEQIELPCFSFGNHLLNLCNTAPIFKFKKYIVLHDVIFMTNKDNQKWWFKLYYKLIIKCNIYTCKHWFTVSKFSKNEIIKYFNIHTQDISVLGNAPSFTQSEIINNDITNKHNLCRDKYFLMVGSQSKRKNVQMVVQLFTKATFLQSKQLVIVGGAFNNFINKEIFHSTNNIYFLGYVNNEDLIALYEHAQALIFPSIYEGFGVPVIDAMSVHCPVMASDIEVLHEICKDGVLYFNPSSSIDLENKIMQFCAINPKDRDILVQKAYLHSINYTWNKYANILWCKILRLEHYDS